MGVSTDFPYATMMQSALKNLKRAQAAEKERFHNCMSTILYCAFALEGYMNFLGKDRATNWDAYEKLRPKDKMNELAPLINYDAEWGRRPLQSFRNAFAFRNFIAHSKTTSIEWNDEPFPPEQDWKTAATLENAEKILEDTLSLIKQLHELAGEGPFPFVSSQGFTSGKCDD